MIPLSKRCYNYLPGDASTGVRTPTNTAYQFINKIEDGAERRTICEAAANFQTYNNSIPREIPLTQFHVLDQREV